MRDNDKSKREQQQPAVVTGKTPIGHDDETAYESATELAKSLHIKKKSTGAAGQPQTSRIARWLNALRGR